MNQATHLQRGWRLLPAFILSITFNSTAGESTNQMSVGDVDALRTAVEKGTIAYRLTTPEELEKLLGPPLSRRKERDGGTELLELEYNDAWARFARFMDPPSPYTLWSLRFKGQSMDIGADRQLVLRTPDDLDRLFLFDGCNGVSLARLDLRSQRARLDRLGFDSRTVWPSPAQLPEGFDPAALIEAGRNPGLGVRKLHASGIDGRGVGLAIIDQPLLRGHSEYKHALVKYEAVDVDGIGPQMHGPGGASLAVGKTCGVAPGAALYYFAVRMWKWLDNTPWSELLERIVALNDTLKETPKIRVVSISLGAFSERPNYARWQQAVRKANAAGILVVTCGPDFLLLGTLKRNEDRRGEEPQDYARGKYFALRPSLCVPAANRAIASPEGAAVLTYDRTGGMRWTVPYLAGLAALGWQANPSLQPQQVIELWRRTAVRTSGGPGVNPAGFVTAAKQPGGP